MIEEGRDAHELVEDVPERVLLWGSATFLARLFEPPGGRQWVNNSDSVVLKEAVEFTPHRRDRACLHLDEESVTNDINHESTERNFESVARLGDPLLQRSMQ